MTDDDDPRPAHLTDGRRIVRLANDYMSSGLWDEWGMVTAEHLELSDGLAGDIAAWQEHFDTHVDPGRGWDDPESEAWNRERAQWLLERLRCELAPSADVQPGP